MKKFLITEKQLKFIVDNFDMLNEQASDIPVTEKDTKTTKTSSDFGQFFLDNMVTINKDENFINFVNKLFTDIQNTIKNKEEIIKIDINVISTATSVRATNKLPENVTKADHTYNGIVPLNKWSNVNKLISEDLITKLPNNYDPKNGYYRISGGNKYLSKTRGELLANYLKKSLTETYRIPEDKITIETTYKVDQPEKKVLATLSIISKPKEIEWGGCYTKYHVSFLNGSLTNAGYWIDLSNGKHDLVGSTKDHAFNFLKDMQKNNIILIDVTRDLAKKFHNKVVEIGQSKGNGMTYINDWAKPSPDEIYELLKTIIGDNNINKNCKPIMRTR